MNSRTVHQQAVFWHTLIVFPVSFISLLPALALSSIVTHSILFYEFYAVSLCYIQF